MKETDSMIVDADLLAQARSAISADESNALKRLADREPILANFLLEKMLVIAGRLSLSGAPSEVVNEVDDCIRYLLMTGIEATRIGHYELWKDAAEGEHLRKIIGQHEQAQSDDGNDDDIEVDEIDF